MHHLSLYFETTAQIPEVEFGGKYGYMRANTIFEGKYEYLRANTDICPVWQIPNTDF
jgi:hypothetical protein